MQNYEHKTNMIQKETEREREGRREREREWVTDRE